MEEAEQRLLCRRREVALRNLGLRQRQNGGAEEEAEEEVTVFGVDGVWADEKGTIPAGTVVAG